MYLPPPRVRGLSVAGGDPCVCVGNGVSPAAGNISAGKSTLCRALADCLGYTLYLEPTIENPFLIKYYKCVGGGRQGRPDCWADDCGFGF